MIMKKKIFFAAVALVALASCTSDDFIGENNNSPNLEEASNAIVFSSGAKATTRADIYGGAAATLLGNKFYVTGVKGDGVPANMSKVFQSYSVEWGANTAGQTESNSSNWEYVGKTHDFTSTTGVSTQSIKYWDLSSDYYDFAAYSLGIGTGTPTPTTATGTAIDYANATSAAYTLSGTREKLSNCYITDMITVAKADYKNVVQLKFRALTSKVRIAMYETIPGYSVKDVRFYVDDATTVGNNTTITNTTATLFGTNAFYESGTYTVSFPHIGKNDATADHNQAHVAISGTTTSGNTQAFGTLNYNASAEGSEAAGGYMGRSSKEPSFAGTAPHYQTVLPNADGKVLELRVNYTLVSIDGSGEEITVHGAKAFVPAAYTKWLPNYAYTYIFKLSDNSTGWTNPSDASDETLAGLFPITFDAVVLDSEDATKEQTTITTVALPSITTYMKGHVYSANDSYPAGDIYLQVMNGGTLVNDLNASGKSFLYTLSDVDATEAEVMDALNIVASEASGIITGRNGLVLTPATFDPTVAAIPGEDGNNITVTPGQAVKFTAAAAGTYAYVYQVSDGADTDVLLAETLTTAPTGWPTDWYTDAAGTTTAPTTFAAGTYYKKMYTNLNKVLAVKVIRVLQ